MDRGHFLEGNFINFLPIESKEVLKAFLSFSITSFVRQSSKLILSKSKCPSNYINITWNDVLPVERPLVVNPWNFRSNLLPPMTSCLNA